MTTAVLRPNATVAAADSVTGAATTHQATNDDSDSSYARCSNFLSAAAIVELTSTTLPAGAVTKSIRARARARWVTALDGPWVRVVKADGSILQTWSTTATSSFANHEGSHSAVALSQAEIDGLLLRFNAATAYLETPASSVDFAELYLDLVYVEQPVTAVVAVTPDPYTASTMVPVTWVNTLDADGGSQTRYQVKVFTAAQYSAGGFDPATSTPYLDTGEVISAATGTTVGPLVNGVTYRAYARVAQTVNGVSHWSAWAYDQFGVDVDTADVASVAVVGSGVTGAITVTVTRDGTGEAWDVVEVQRSLDAGVTWVDVRGATYVDATGHANTFVVVDHEVPNGTVAVYRARATWFSSGLPITGAWTQSSTVSWTSSDTWLKVPGDPARNTVVKLQGMPRLERPRRLGVHRILGGHHPVVVSDERGAAEGSLVFWFRTADDAEDIAAALEAPVVLLVGPPEWHRWGSRYLAVGSETEGWEEGAVLGLRARRGTIQVDVWEVGPPPDPTAGR